MNYDMPDVPENYVHRIGRTARAGAGGMAIAFCAPYEREELRAVERLIRLRIPVKPVPQGIAHPAPAPEHRVITTPGAHGAGGRPAFAPGAHAPAGRPAFVPGSQAPSHRPAHAPAPQHPAAHHAPAAPRTDAPQGTGHPAPHARPSPSHQTPRRFLWRKKRDR